MIEDNLCKAILQTTILTNCSFFFFDNETLGDLYIFTAITATNMTVPLALALSRGESSSMK